MELKPGTELYRLVWAGLATAAERPDPPAPHCALSPSDKAKMKALSDEMFSAMVKHNREEARILKRLT